MAVKSKKEIIDALSTILGENSSDEALSLLEDVSDTLDKSGADLQAELEKEKTKYNNLDKEWREKYKARFLQSKEEAKEQDELFKEEQQKQEQKDAQEERAESVTYDDLFSSPTDKKGD